MNAKLWIHLAQQMNVVRHNFQLNDLSSQFDCRLVDDLFQAPAHTIHKHRAPILGAPDHMIFAGIDNVSIAFEWNICSHKGDYTTIFT